VTLAAVRALGAGEWRTWRALRLRALASDPDAFGTTAAQAGRQSDAEWCASVEPRPGRQHLVAERCGVAIGMARTRTAPDGLRTRLHSIWVAPEARRGGVARALIEAAVAWAQAGGACELGLEVAETQHAAVALYQACGFRDSGYRTPLRPGGAIARRHYRLALRTLVMGVVNVTPDSFSDGGRYLGVEQAVAHGLALLRDGADILDVGGEATNPRAQPVSVAEELRRVLPVVQQLAAAGATVSIDTTKAAVARAAVELGARIINDVSGGLFDPDMAQAIGEATYIAGHLRGRTIAEVFAAEARVSPLGWQLVADELGERLAALPDGVRDRAWIDPGLGFGKGADPEPNLALLRHCGALGIHLDRLVVVGASRKRFVRRAFQVGHDGDDGLAALDAASVAASLDAIAAGANVVRVHNVALLRAALALYTKR
jgi:dihydropteroate synthase